MKRYIKNSYSLPVDNECVPCWEFDKADFSGSIKELIKGIKSNLSRLDFVSSVGTSGFSPVNSDTFALDIDIQMNKSADDLTDSDIDAIEDCGLEFGSIHFEV